MSRNFVAAVALVGILVLAGQASADLLAESDLVYLGAFAGGPSNLAYAAHTGIAYSPTGDSGNGSFYIVGTGGGTWLGEFANVDESALLKASDGKVYADLAVGATLFHTGGGSKRAAGFGIGASGLKVLPQFGNQTTDKVYATRMGAYSSANNSYSELDASYGSRDNPAGLPVEYGPWDTTTSPGYDDRRPGSGLGQIPQDWVDANLPDGNYKLATVGNGAYGYRGPAIVAYRPTDANGDPEATGFSPGVVLLQSGSTTAYPGESDDRWEGLAWMDDYREALIVSGRKDLETVDADPDILTPRLLLYDPADLAAVVADGSQAAWQWPLPYAEIDLDQYWFNQIDTQTNQRTAFGIEYVSDTQRLYILEYNNHDEPIVHVFGVPEPATMGLLGLGSLGLTVLRRRRKK